MFHEEEQETRRVRRRRRQGPGAGPRGLPAEVRAGQVGEDGEDSSDNESENDQRNRAAVDGVGAAGPAESESDSSEAREEPGPPLTEREQLRWDRDRLVQIAERVAQLAPRGNSAAGEEGGYDSDGPPREATGPAAPTLTNAGWVVAIWASCLAIWALAKRSEAWDVVWHNVSSFQAVFHLFGDLWQDKYDVQRVAYLILVCSVILGALLMLFRMFQQQITGATVSWLFGRQQNHFKAHLARVFVVSASQGEIVLLTTTAILALTFESLFAGDAPGNLMWSMFAGLFYVCGAIVYNGNLIGIVDDDDAWLRWGRHVCWWFATGAARLHASFIGLRGSCNEDLANRVPDGFTSALGILAWHPLPVISLGFTTLVCSVWVGRSVDSFVKARSRPRGTHGGQDTVGKAVSRLLRGFAATVAQSIVAVLTIILSDNLAVLLVSASPAQTSSWTWDVSVKISLIACAIGFIVIAFDAVLGVYQLLGLARVEFEGFRGIQSQLGGNGARSVSDVANGIRERIDALFAGDAMQLDRNSLARAVGESLELINDLRILLDADGGGDDDSWLTTAIASHLDVRADTPTTLPHVGIEFQSFLEYDTPLPAVRSALFDRPTVVAGLSTVSDREVDVDVDLHRWKRRAREIFIAVRGDVFHAARSYLWQQLLTIPVVSRALQFARMGDSSASGVRVRVVATIERAKMGNVCPDAWGRYEWGLSMRTLRRLGYALERFVQPIRPYLQSVRIVMWDSAAAASTAQLSTRAVPSQGGGHGAADDGVYEGLLTGIDEAIDGYLQNLVDRTKATFDYDHEGALEAVAEEVKTAHDVGNLTANLRQHKNRLRTVTPATDVLGFLNAVWPSLVTVKRLFEALGGLKKRDVAGKELDQMRREVTQLADDCLTAYYREVLHAIARVLMGGNIGYAAAATVILMAVQYWNSLEIANFYRNLDGRGAAAADGAAAPAGPHGGGGPDGPAGDGGPEIADGGAGPDGSASGSGSEGADGDGGPEAPVDGGDTSPEESFVVASGGDEGETVPSDAATPVKVPDIVKAPDIVDLQEPIYAPDGAAAAGSSAPSGPTLFEELAARAAERDARRLSAAGQSAAPQAGLDVDDE